MQQRLPELFALFAERLGVTLLDRPTVLFSFTPSDMGGLQSAGGALPDDDNMLRV